MGREDMFAMGKLHPVDQPTPAPEIADHGFDQVSKQARADPRLSHRAFRVLACLEGYCFGDNRESWACNRTIGKTSGGIGINAVRLALRELEKYGYLEVIPDPSRMRGSRLKLLYRLKRPEQYE
jgi:hypothetical protein